MPPDLPVGFDELGVDGLDVPNPAVGVGVGNLVQQVPVGVGLQFHRVDGQPARHTYPGPVFHVPPQPDKVRPNVLHAPPSCFWFTSAGREYASLAGARKSAN